MSTDKKRLAILSDLHIGNPNTNMDLVKRDIRKCKRDSINDVWLGGDLIEYVSKYSVGFQNIPIPKQIDKIVELLEPIKHKISKIITGNHEERAERTHHLNPTENIALRLGLFDKYVGSHVDMGKYYGTNYYFEHALRGGGTTFNYLRTLAKRFILNFPEVGLFILPHYHKLHTIKVLGLDLDKTTRIERVVIFEGGYVDYWESFGHITKHEISHLGCHKILFYNDKIEVDRL